jgi:hypothetical protein
MYSDYVNNIAYPVEKEKIALATIKIRKNTDEDVYLDLTNVAFAMGAWGNQWNYKLFAALNGEEKSVLDMSKDETTEIIFPIAMFDMQFTKEDWKKIEESELDIILGYYPEKYILRGPGNK